MRGETGLNRSQAKADGNEATTGLAAGQAGPELPQLHALHKKPEIQGFPFNKCFRF